MTHRATSILCIPLKTRVQDILERLAILSRLQIATFTHLDETCQTDDLLVPCEREHSLQSRLRPFEGVNYSIIL